MMKKILFLHSILTILIATVNCAAAINPIHVMNTEKIYELNGKWHFESSDQLIYASAEFDDSGWEFISVPGQWHMMGKRNLTTVWYRKTVIIEKNYLNTAVSILTPVIADAHELYFNGVKIGSAGKISPRGKIIKKSSIPGLYSIPADIINFGNENVIAVRVSDDVGWGGFVTSDFFIGSEKELSLKYRRNILWYASISFLLIFLGIYYLILFGSRPKEKIYFYYALLTIVGGTTLFGSLSMTYLIVDNFWINHFVFHTGLNTLVIVALLFFYNYFEYEKDIPYKIFMALYKVLFLILLMTPLHLSVLKFYGNISLTVSIVMYFPAMAWIVFLIFKAIKLNKMGANIVGVGTLLCIIFLIGDVLTFLDVIHTRRLVAEGFTLFIISISVDMALRYAKLYDALQTAQKKLIEKEKLEHEIKLAAEVQKSLLPEVLPKNPKFNIDAYLEPAHMVGGDFYDVIKIDDEHFGILVGDVADKGIHAAMFMAVTRTLFYCEVPNSISPAKVAKAVHHHIMGAVSLKKNFVTVFYGILHCPTGLLTYVRAGHEPPLLYRPGQPIDTISSKGRFLGMIDDLELPEYTLQLHPGDRLILYSDGVPEATNLNGEQFGSDRFMDCVKENGSLPAPELIQQIKNTTETWTQGSDPFDDLTLLVVEAK